MIHVADQRDPGNSPQLHLACASLSVTGADGLPIHQERGNVQRPCTRAQSYRCAFHPRRSAAAPQRGEALVRQNTPYNAVVGLRAADAAATRAGTPRVRAPG